MSGEQSQLAPAGYRFGGFDLCPRRRQLRCGEREIELQGKVFDLIHYLVAHADRVVDKNELLDAVWPRQIVSEAALARCVMKARRALDDDAADARILQTIHGRGYRLVAAVEAIDHLDPAPEASRLPANGLVTRLGWPARGTGLVLLLLLLAGVWLLQRADQATAPATQLPLRLAILPVENHTGDTSLDWSALALMGAIGDVLRLGDGLPVVPAVEILPLRESLLELDGAQIWQRLNETVGSSHVVQSRLLAQPGQLRLSYGLIAADGVLRRRTVVAPDVGGIAHAAGNDLLAALGWQRSGERPVDDAFANEAFLRARALRLQGDLPGALELYRLAVTQAPGSFWPRLDLALCLRDLGQSSEALAQLQMLQTEADQGASLEAQLSVRNALAILHWRAGRHEQAEQLLQEALQGAEQQGDLNRISSILTNLGILADFRRQPDQARAYLQRASEAALASGYPAVPGQIRHSLGQVEIDAGHLEVADAHLQAALAQFRALGNRRFEAITLNTLSRLRRRQGRSEEARALVEQALAVHRELGARGAEATALQSLAALEAEAGRLAQAIAWNEEALRVSEAIEELPRVISAERLRGELEAGRGDWAAARDWLLRALRHGQQSGNPVSVARSEAALIDVLLRQGALDEAATALQALIETSSKQTLPQRIHRQICLLRARIHHRRRELQQARAVFSACAAQAGDEDPLAMAQFDAALAIDEGDLERAERLIDALAPGTAREQAEVARLAARLAAAGGDAQAALAHEQSAMQLAGEHWLAADRERLLERRRAAGQQQPGR